MNKRPLSMSPAYVQYVRGLRRLHALIAEGRADSPEADDVRDEMDEPGYALSEAERRRVNGLSEDLYSISDPPSEPLPSNPQATARLLEAAGAREAGDWDRALGLLRRWGRYLDPADLAFQRGLAWREAGDDSIAFLFFQHAARLAPQNEKYVATSLREMRTFDPANALEQARRILGEDEAHPPFVVLVAGDTLFAHASSVGSPDRIHVLRGLIEIMERTLRRVEARARGSDLPFDPVMMAVITLLAGCFTGLGDTPAALQYLDLGLAADPGSPILLLARGVARYGSSPQAIEDLKRAIQYGYPSLWPYFFLAHHNLITGNFNECFRMCDRAMDYSMPDGVRARIYDWRAIARSELGFPAEMVRSDFEEAIRLAPEDDEIRENFDRFNRSSSQHGARPHDWSTSKPSVIQSLYRAELPPLLPAA